MSEATAPTENQEQSGSRTAQGKKAYRYYALGILTLVYIFNFIDRQTIVILSEYIIEDLDLSLADAPD